MKRRIAPRLLLLCAAASAASWLEEHNLVVRRDVEEDALGFASSGAFAPPPPNEVRRRLNGWEDADDRGGGGGCSSPLVAWTTDRVRDMGYKTYKTLHENRILSMAYVYKHYVDRNEGEEFFVNQQQTEELRRRHRDAVAFWSAADLDGTLVTDNILLLSMHGTDLMDGAKLIPTISRMFDYDDMSDVLSFASRVQSLISDLPDGPDNPLLTMNAVATRSTHDEGTYGGHADRTRRTKDSIVIGDGVLKFLYDSGLERAGPDFVYAHELGHHLQFRMVDNLASGNHAGITSTAIESFRTDDRKKELMADAIGGYFLAHERGGDFLEDEIEVFDRTAFSTGDCNVGGDDHHGTPRQRRCAALWGASRAAAGMEGTTGRAGPGAGAGTAWSASMASTGTGTGGRDRGAEEVLDAEAFAAGFVRAYGGMLRLDPATCALVLDETSADEASQWHTEEVAGSDEDYRESGGRPGIDLNGWLDENGNDEHREKDIEEWESGIDLDNWLEGNSYNGYGENDDGGGYGRGYDDDDDNRGYGLGDDGGRGVDLQDWLDSIEQHNAKHDAASRGGPTRVHPHPNPSDHGTGGPPKNLMRGESGPPDAGAPAQPARMKNAVTVRNCDMPWVHCHTSSAVAGIGRRPYAILALTASAMVALF